MAENKLREQMTETAKAPPVDSDWTIAEVGTRRIANLARQGRQPDTTLSNYEADIRLHFTPFFGDTPIDRIEVQDVEGFLDECLDAELREERGQRPLSISTVAKLYTHLSGIFEFGIRKHWCRANPCKEVDKPASADAEDDAEIRFVTMDELEMVLPSRAPPRASTPRRRLSGPRWHGSCATCASCSGRRLAPGSAALPRPRCTCTGPRRRPCSSTISPGSSGSSI